MTRCFPPSPLGKTVMGADQLDWLPHITFAIRSLFHPWPICSVSSLLGMAFVILVQRFQYLLSSLSKVWFQWQFHLRQTESCNPLAVPQVLFQYFVLAYDMVVWKYLVLSVAILCVVEKSGFVGISSMGGSRCPTYSYLLNLMCLLV